MVSAAACLMAIGMVSIPVCAGYQGFRSGITSDKVRARMQEFLDDEQQEYENGRFPERELTDEEILQILDFNSTREYVLEQNPEVQRQKMEQYEETIREKQGDGLLP